MAKAWAKFRGERDTCHADSRLTIFGMGMPGQARVWIEVGLLIGILGMLFTTSDGKRTAQTALTGRAVNAETAGDRRWSAKSGFRGSLPSEAERNTTTETKNIRYAILKFTLSVRRANSGS